MNREAIARLLPSAAIVVLVGACMPPPPPVPTVTLLGRTCAEKPDLASATAVPLADDKPVRVTLDDKMPCVEPPGSAKAAYVAFTLPDVSDEYILSVTSVPVGDGRLLPRLILADSNGNKLRDIPPDMFMAHGASLHAGLRSHPGERYLIVSSDSDTVGQTKSQIMDGIQVSTTYTGRGIAQVQTGYESNVTLVNAFNGTVVVAAQPIPKAQ